MSLSTLTEQFSQFCRTGHLPSYFRDVPKRMSVYPTLVRRKVERVLMRAFPLTHQTLLSVHWNELVDQFLQEDFLSPFLWKLSETFVAFVRKGSFGSLWQIPYLSDLVHFEWLEIEMYMMPDCNDGQFTLEGKVLDDRLFLNPESRIVSYSYPIFESESLFREMKKGDYFLLAFRHSIDKEIYFISLSPFFRMVLELIKKAELAGREALITAANHYHLEENRALDMGEQFLFDLFHQGAIYGFTCC